MKIRKISQNIGYNIIQPLPTNTKASEVAPDLIINAVQNVKFGQPLSEISLPNSRLFNIHINKPNSKHPMTLPICSKY